MNLNISNINSYFQNFTSRSKKNKISNSQPTNNISQSSNLSQIKQDTFELSIGYVNDLHGQTNNMMRILSGIKGDLKLSAGDNDIGDEKNATIHKATSKFLNIADIKASALGNHELDTTQKDCINSLNEFNGDMLSVNYRKIPLNRQHNDDIKKNGRAELDKHLKHSTVVEIKGEQIGIIGASPIDMFERLTHPNYYLDSYIKDLEDTIYDIKDEIRILKEQGINKIILLSHLGNKRDRIIAQTVNDIDVIIGGHSHELIKNIKKDKNLFFNKNGEPTIITQAGRDGNYFGNLNLEFDKNGIIIKAQNNIGDTGLFHKNMINEYIFNKILGTPENVGYVKFAPAHPNTLIEENPHANFVCDIMRKETDSDIALWQNAGVRNYFHEGIINTSDIKDMAPFFDYVVIANVSEKKIVNLLKSTIENSYKSSAKKPGLIATSGLEYTIDTKNGKLIGANFVDKNGNLQKINIDNPSETKTYKIVADEFLMSAGADFPVLATEDEYIKQYEYDKDYLVCEYLKKNKEPIVINHTGRIHFINE